MNSENSFAESGTSPTISPWLTAEQAAQYLQVKPRTVLTWVKHGNLKAYKLSGIERCTYRFRQEDLDAMLESSSPFAAPTIRRVS